MPKHNYKKASGSLPPLAILEVGDCIEGTIEQVDTVKKEVKRGGKKVIDERMFYRIRLESECSCVNAAKEKVTYKVAELVTLPGSGALDSTLGGISTELSGGDPENPNFKVLEGAALKVTRTKDDKIKKGAFQGKPVKTYEVLWEAPVKK